MFTENNKCLLHLQSSQGTLLQAANLATLAGLPEQWGEREGGRERDYDYLLLSTQSTSNYPYTISVHWYCQQAGRFLELDLYKS